MKTLFNNLDVLCPNIVTQKISNKLNICDKRNMMTLIFGETGRGKTLTAKHWCANNPRAVYIQLKAATSLSSLIRQIAKELTGQVHANTFENKDAIEQFLLANDKLIVIDEANQLLSSASTECKKKNMEYIRLDLFEQTNTPVALIFTTYTMGEFTHGRLSTFLEQFLGRAQNKLEIEPKLFKVSEITPIVRYYFPEANEELINASMEVAMSNGKLRSLVNHMARAKELCDEDPKKYKISGQLLKDIRDLYESGGVWPEE